MAENITRLTQAALRQFCTQLLEAHELSNEDAQTVADCLIRADLRGHDTHGVLRLPKYLHRMRLGLINSRPRLQFERVAGAAGRLDGDDGFGFVVARRAVEHGIEIASETGIAAISVHRSTHFGMAANYLLQAMDAGMFAIVSTNASKTMAPWGGREPLLGTSPFAAGAPGAGDSAFILDMAPTMAAGGKIRRAARRGEAIPEGFAIDAQGRPTTDPNAAINGGLFLPIGGPKGAGIAMLMEILSGVMSGAAFGGEVRSQGKDFDRPQGVGHFILVMRPDLFIPQSAYEERMQTFADRVHAIAPAEGFSKVLMPGEPEAEIEAQRKVEGIPFVREDLQDLIDEGRRFDLDLQGV